MLSLEGFPPPPPLPLRKTTHHKPISQSLHFSSKAHQTLLPFLSDALTHPPFCPVLGRKVSNLCVSASKSRRKGGNAPLEVNNLDEKEEEYEDDDGGDDEEEEEEEEEDEEEFIPLKYMKEWTKNKPRGFGEGKQYDTSVEDNLLDEMERAREAQLANINKLKTNPENPNSKKGILPKQEAPEDVPSGIRVRLVNLPKKRNIHKDLQLAFKGVRGIVNILPAVSGNKKTRDPICKGFAFIDLKSEEDAKRFVQIVSRLSISFGKIQKQVRCEIMNSKSSGSANKHSVDGNYNAPQGAIPSLGEVPDVDTDKIDDISSDSKELITSDESEDEDDDRVPAQGEEDTENMGSFSLSEPSVDDSLGTRSESVLDSSSSKQQEKVRANKKKLESKSKKTKVPKLSIPGSANRLRIREKAVLTGVLSKYAVQSASASKEKP